MAQASPDPILALLGEVPADRPLAERNLWLVRLLDGLRRPAPQALPDSHPAPLPVQRLAGLVEHLEQQPALARQVAELLDGIWADMDTVGLFAEVGFAPRMALWHEFQGRLRRRLLPGTTDTQDLGALFDLLFPHADDAAWLAEIDTPLLERIARLLAEPWALPAWRREMRESIAVLLSHVRATSLSAAMRVRMEPGLLEGRPFHVLPLAWAEVERALDGPEQALGLPPALQYLHALLDRCRAAVHSVPEHLDAHGVSVDLMFTVEQLDARLDRVEDLLAVLVSPEPAPELRRLLSRLVADAHERRSLRTLFARHYSLLARKVAERSAETGEHYITRNRDEYHDMLRRAAGGGAVIGGTTLLKFAILALGLSAFWSGVWAGLNYAASFVLIHLLHWTVATKQPAMTAPALAARLRRLGDAAGLEGFVDEVSHLVRSQIAGIIGNLALAAPVVLLAQWTAARCWGAPLVGEQEARHVLHSLDPLGPSLAFAAFTGVLLFGSSLIAGWVENWFVFHRVDRGIAWNPRLVGWLGPARAQAWSRWWRGNISGLAANASLGLLLGLVPVLLHFVGLGLDVRHVTLSTGQLAAAAGVLGWPLLQTAEFWRCVACILGIGALNVGVSFYCAFRVALRSQGIKLADRRRVRAALWQRLRRAPRSFLLPPRWG